MKNLKRVLALVLVVAMVFTLAISASAASFTDSKDIKHVDAVNTLVELGVIKGYPEGDFRPATPVTRAEMAKMITVILNRGVDDPSQFSDGVTDLTDISWNWAKSYITYCYLLDIIAGYGNGEFRPEGNVTVQEAAKMILAALGYDVAQEGLVGLNWSVNTNALANQAGIYEGITQGVGEAATRDTIAQMLYNMLTAQTVSYDVNYYTGISKLIKGERAISKYFDITVYEGVATANEYADLFGSSPLAKNKTEIYIKDVNGIFDIDDDDDTGFRTFNVASGSEVLGKMVTIFYRDNDKKVIGNVMVNGDNVFGLASKGDLKDAAKALGLTYKAGEADIFVNYSAPDFDYGWNDTTHPLAPYFFADDGYGYYNFLAPKDVAGMDVIIIDFDNDGVVDVVNYVIPIITSVTGTETKGPDTLFIFGAVSNNKGVDVDKLVTDAELEKKQTVSVTYIQGTYYVDVLKTAEGEVTKYDKSGAMSITLSDDVKYSVSDLPVDASVKDVMYKRGTGDASLKDGIKLDDFNITYDAKGNIALLKGLANKDSFALTTGAAWTTNDSLDSVYRVKLLTADGKTQTVEIDRNKSVLDFNFSGAFDKNSDEELVFYISGSKYELHGAWTNSPYFANGNAKEKYDYYGDNGSLKKNDNYALGLFTTSKTEYFYIVEKNDNTVEYYTYIGKAKSPAADNAWIDVITDKGGDTALAVLVYVNEDDFGAIDTKTYAYIHTEGQVDKDTVTYEAILVDDKGVVTENKAFVVKGKPGSGNMNLHAYEMDGTAAKLGSAIDAKIVGYVNTKDNVLVFTDGTTAEIGNATLYDHTAAGKPKLNADLKFQPLDVVYAVVNKDGDAHLIVLVSRDVVDSDVEVLAALDANGEYRVYPVDANGVPGTTAYSAVTWAGTFTGVGYYYADILSNGVYVITDDMTAPTFTTVYYLDDADGAGAGTDAGFNTADDGTGTVLTFAGAKVFTVNTTTDEVAITDVSVTGHTDQDPFEAILNTAGTAILFILD